jgi:hypothetical protein
MQVACISTETTFIIFPGRGQFKEQFFQPWNRLLLSRVTIRVSNFRIFMCYLSESPKNASWERRICRGLTHISPMKMLNKSRLNFIFRNVGTRCSQCCRVNSIFFFSYWQNTAYSEWTQSCDIHCFVTRRYKPFTKLDKGCAFHCYSSLLQLTVEHTVSFMVNLMRNVTKL